MRRGRVELAGVRAFQPAGVARELYHRALHAQADAEVGNQARPGVVHGVDHALHAALAEAPRHQDAVIFLQQVVGSLVDDAFRLHPVDVGAQVVGQAAVHQRFFQALVRFLELHVLANNGDGDLVAGVVEAMDQVVPLAQVAFAGLQPQVPQDDLVEPFVAQRHRHFVDGGHVFGGDDGVLGHVAEQRDFGLQVARQKPPGAAQQDIGLDAELQQILDAVLGGLGLQLAGGGDVRHQREVDEQGVVAAFVLPHLPDGLQEGLGFDVADRAAHFHDDHVHARGDLANCRLDLVGDVGNHLHGLSQVLAAPLLGDDGLVNAAGGDVVGPGQHSVGETLVVPQVQVGFGAVVGDEHLAVLKGAHGARIDIEVGVELLQRDPQTPAFQQRADRRRRQALAQGRDHTAGNEDVLRHYL